VEAVEASSSLVDHPKFIARTVVRVWFGASFENCIEISMSP
jgi:hypothetical protein